MNNSSSQVNDNKNELVLKAGTTTPFVCFIPDGQLTIRGRSIPLDGCLFYEPILDWVENYIKNPDSQTTLTVELEYMNDISSKYLLRIIKVLNNACDRFSVKWRYDAEDEDMLELGQFICSTSGSEFGYIMLK